MVSLNQIKICEVCNNNELLKTLDLGKLPLCDDLIPINRSETCEEYLTEILFCNKCFTAHQKYQVEKKLLFPESYHYRARFTKDVVDGMQELVSHCKEIFGSLSEKKVLDIGCNDGSLLDFFKNENCKTFGIEPTDAAYEADEKGHTVYKEFFDIKSSKKFLSKHGYPDIITFTNVFAHIENLEILLNSLKNILSSETKIVIENHYLGSILSSNQFDTFYHEHPRTYSYNSFLHISKNLGLKILDASFPARYGGNIRIFMGNEKLKSKIDKSFEDEIFVREEKFIKSFRNMSKKIEAWKKNKTLQLSKLVSENGYIYAKAFPGRAAILIRILNLDENTIKAVFEKEGSKKIGHYVPGTRIPICDDAELFSSNNNKIPILNLAWHIPNEIRSYLKENKINNSVVDIINSTDF